MYGAELPIKQYAGSAGGPVANQKLTFQEWVVQDPVTRGGANAQQLYAEYVEQFDNPFNPYPSGDQINSQPSQPSASDLFSKINAPEVDVSYGGVGGFLDRIKNSTLATAYGDISNFAVGAADVANDYFAEINKEKAQRRAKR